MAPSRDLGIALLFEPRCADGRAPVRVLLRYVCARMAVSVHALQLREDLRKADGGDIATHMETVNRVLNVPGISYTAEQLELSVHCAAEVLLQLAPQVEEVCARQCRAMLAHEGAVLDRPAPRCMLPGKHKSVC